MYVKFSLENNQNAITYIEILKMRY